MFCMYICAVNSGKTQIWMDSSTLFHDPCLSTLKRKALSRQCWCKSVIRKYIARALHIFNLSMQHTPLCSYFPPNNSWGFLLLFFRVYQSSEVSLTKFSLSVWVFYNYWSLLCSLNIYFKRRLKPEDQNIFGAWRLSIKMKREVVCVNIKGLSFTSQSRRAIMITRKWLWSLSQIHFLAPLIILN